MNTKEEILAIVNELDLDPKTREKLIRMIEAVEGGTLDDDTLSEIKVILLEEEERALDAAAAELGIDVVNDPQLKEVEEEYKSEVAQIKADFDADMAGLDGQLEQLEAAEKQLQGADDAMQIDTLTASLKA